MTKKLTLLIASLALVAGSFVGFAGVADASGGGATIRTGNCSGSADWKLKGKIRDGRFEVEWEVDSNRNGQNWAWTLSQNGTQRAAGTATTRAPSGSFSVERRMPNTSGADTFVGTARNLRTGQTCTGTLTL